LITLIGENLGTHRFQRAVLAGGAFEKQWAASPRLHAGSDAYPGVSRFIRRIQIFDCIQLLFAWSSFNYGRGGSPERAAGEWMEYYGVSTDWLETFLRSAPEQEHEHIDWVVANKDDASTNQAQTRQKGADRSRRMSTVEGRV
jgi:hypothetical protein